MCSIIATIDAGSIEYSDWEYPMMHRRLFPKHSHCAVRVSTSSRQRLASREDDLMTLSQQKQSDASCHDIDLSLT